MVDSLIDSCNELGQPPLQLARTESLAYHAVDDPGNLLYSGFHLIIHDDVRIQIYRLQLLFGTLEPKSQRSRVLRLAGLEALQQHLGGRRQDEDEQSGWKRSLKLAGSLDVDIHHYIAPGRQHALDLRAQSPLKVPVTLP